MSLVGRNSSGTSGTVGATVFSRIDPKSGGEPSDNRVEADGNTAVEVPANPPGIVEDLPG